MKGLKSEEKKHKLLDEGREALEECREKCNDRVISLKKVFATNLHHRDDVLNDKLRFFVFHGYD